MTLHSKFPEDFKKETVDRIDKRFYQLNELTQDFLDRCIRYLFITNTGGALAIISYMGTAGIVKANGFHKTALVMFVVGVICAGVLNLLLLRFTDKLTQDWRTESGKYYADQLHYDPLWDEDEARSEKAECFYYVGYVSFGLFIFGALISLWAFFA